MNKLAIVFLGLLTVSAALARMSDFRESWAVMESLQHLPPKFRAEWLRKRGYDNSYYTTYRKPESTGLRLVGKWGRGPSVEVTGQDSLVVLTLGSEVAILNFADPDSPEVLTEIQLDYIPRQSLIQGSLLFTGGNGIQLWDITNPAQPIPRSVIPYGVSDFAIWDTFLYFIGRDTFFIYSFANASSPYRIGCYRDSGNVTSVTATTAIIMGAGDYIAFADIANPSHPHRVGSYAGWVLSAAARNSICCITLGNSNQPTTLTFRILDISNPASPFPLSSIDSCGAYDIYLSDSLAFLSGYYCGGHEFRILSVRDSTRPRHIGMCASPGAAWGVWANRARALGFVADQQFGLAVFDIRNLVAPVRDTSVMVAGYAEDVCVDGNRAYVADDGAGMRIVDVTDPRSPVELGGIDSANLGTNAVVACDSFAFIGGWPGPPLRSIQVSDPAHPIMAGGGGAQTDPQDMVLRDTLLYLAGRLRFNVVNVARPRQPVLVGSCNIQGYGSDAVLQDTLAYVSALNLTVVDVAQPDSPRVVFNGLSEVEGLDVVDTVAYLAFDGLKTASIANPAAPYLLDTVPLVDFITDVVVMDTLAVVSGRKLHVFNVSDPRELRLLGTWTAPGWCHKLFYTPSYIYAACYDAGVCILETTTTSLHDDRVFRHWTSGVRVWPSVATGRVRVEADEPVRAVSVFDAAGTRLAEGTRQLTIRRDSRRWDIDCTGLPAGVYFVEVTTREAYVTTKVVKPKGR